MGTILGGGTQGAGQTTPTPGGLAGLGGLLEQLTGGARSGTEAATRGGTPAGGGLGDLLGGLIGAGGAGDLGGLLGSLAGKGAAPSNNRSFGDILNSSFANKGEPEVAPTAEQNAVAGLMLKAMIQAAKSDGKVDQAEQEKLLGSLGEVSPEERAFVKAEMARPTDIVGLARLVPDGLQAQVYTMSVMAIDLDNQAEANYLHGLAEALSITPRTVNQIHAQLGLPALYA